ncbi:MAG: 1-acyl-sn-glycerol-3-phosphate acyltransferase [Burkholderiales bacterium]|jgi:1-acyl-sn-glycerol-3-phosphate acyltransferase|nr:1-acyl-sn-glycerol-3-phosphate acyltransferase [Burkholderiales bacterium]
MSPTPLHLRYLRIARASAHVLHGLWIVWVRFPRMTPKQQDRVLERWSKKLLSILNVRVRPHNAPHVWPERTLVVTNHVSWLDIFAIYAVAPGLFVAKSEIAGWPVVGSLVAKVGTLFIERGRSRHARHTKERIAEVLATGRRVAVCPEGTTSDGSHVRRFHAALLQPAIDAAAIVQPVALRYTDAHGEFTLAAAYIDDMSLGESLWRIASMRRMHVEVRFADPIDATGATRRELSAAAHEAVAALLRLSPPGTQPGKPAGRGDAPPTAPRPTRSPYPAQAD